MAKYERFNTQRTGLEILRALALAENSVQKEESKGLSANDFTDEEKEKLLSLENYDDTGIKSEIAVNRSTLGYQRKNLLKNGCGSRTSSGVTAAVNADGTITLNGTSTKAFVLYASVSDGINNPGDTPLKKVFPDGEYYLSGGISGKAYMQLFSFDGTRTGTIQYGGKVTVNGDHPYNCVRITVEGGKTFDNEIIYPMMRLADIVDSAYEPYKPSVEERLAANAVSTYANLALKSICPTNEMLFDDIGAPSIYVQRNPRTLAQLVTDGDSSVHPAFIVNSQQVKKLMFGKFQGVAHNNRIYSLPGEDPLASITLNTYETYCKNKGDGHHCITAAEWAFLALCAKKDGKMPNGNNNYGKDVSETAYAAIPSMALDSSNRVQRTATGTGPLTWSDTGDLSGIWDLNGNVWEWVSGIRLVKGELQMIPYNNAADSACDTSAASAEWRAINAQATGYDNLYLTPNGSGTTANSVKLNRVNDQWQWAASITDANNSNRGGTFGNTTMSGLSAFCQMFMRAMALAPDGEASEYEGDYFRANNANDELCAYRGGAWNNGVGASIFALYFNNIRSYSSTGLGGRPAYYEQPVSNQNRTVLGGGEA